MQARNPRHYRIETIDSFVFFDTMEEIIESLGHKKQEAGSLHCGYCVLQYMKEIVETVDPVFETMFKGSNKAQYFKQDDYNEVRAEWSQYIYDLLDI